MEPELWWKNFGLGQELDLGAAYIYDGIYRLHRLQRLQHSVDIYQVLHDLSFGIERIAKVAIILFEHGEFLSAQELEESLRTHNTQGLIARVDQHAELGLSQLHREFLHLLSEFYRTHRYDRLGESSIPRISKEKEAFLSFIGKHLGDDVGEPDQFQGIQNTDQIRRFIGRIVKKISEALFMIIRARASELNIYTHELRNDSKAIKVFYGERLDFIEEDIKRREMLLFLMAPDSEGSHISILREFGALSLDPAMTGSYIRALFDDNELRSVEGEIDELYLDVENVSERLAFIRSMDSDYFADDSDEES